MRFLGHTAAALGPRSVSSRCDRSRPGRAGRRGCRRRESRSVPRAHRALLTVLHLPFLDGLPLHVARRVRSTGAERHDVVDDITRAAARVATAAHELIFCLPTPGNAPATVTLAVGRISRSAVGPGGRVAAWAAGPAGPGGPAGRRIGSRSRA